MRSSVVLFWRFCIIAFLTDYGAHGYFKSYRNFDDVVVRGVLMVEYKSRNSFPSPDNAPIHEVADILHNDLNEIPKHPRNYEEEDEDFLSGGETIGETDVELKPSENRFAKWLLNIINKKERLKKILQYHRPIVSDTMTPPVQYPTTTIAAPTSASLITEEQSSTTVKSSSPVRKTKKKHKKPRKP